MANIVGYLYKGTRYTPLGMREHLVRQGVIPRSAFAPMVGFDWEREPEIATVIDAWTAFFMDQPETYSDQDWPKFIFDDEVEDREVIDFKGALDVIADARTVDEAAAKTAEEEAQKDFADIADSQGWDDSSRLVVMDAFIREQGVVFMQRLVQFATEVAAEENGEDSDV